MPSTPGASLVRELRQRLTERGPLIDGSFLPDRSFRLHAELADDGRRVGSRRDCSRVDAWWGHHGILGFTTASWRGCKSRKAWRWAGRPRNPGRLCDLAKTGPYWSGIWKRRSGVSPPRATPSRRWSSGMRLPRDRNCLNRPQNQKRQVCG